MVMAIHQSVVPVAFPSIPVAAVQVCLCLAQMAKVKHLLVVLRALL
jgi:hypothetical protein